MDETYIGTYIRIASRGGRWGCRIEYNYPPPRHADCVEMRRRDGELDIRVIDEVIEIDDRRGIAICTLIED